MNSKIRTDTLVALHFVLLGLLLSASPASQAKEPYRWIQYVPGGIEARAITEESDCPSASLDGKAARMAQRSTPGAQYPVLVCALPVPQTTVRVDIGGVSLPLPKKQPQRILVIGDTGCRIKDKRVQACNDPVAWPFRAGAAHVAQLKPDLILHVGDFHYRETACLEGFAGCAGSPHGDTWEVWEADFFAPVGALLATAPWVLVRGNHEECDRGGRGWARTLDPYAWSADTGCLGPGEPYTVDLGGVRLGVLDVSTADENEANEKQAERYRAQFASIAKTNAGQPLWIAQHRPIWAVEQTVPKLGGDNKTLALAARQDLADNIQALISGHHHVLEVLTYEDALPPQFVSGHGGDDLSRGVPAQSDGMAINNVRVKRGVAKTGIFGYSMLERQSNSPQARWTFSGFDYQGTLLLKCELDGRNVSCNAI